MSKFNVTFVPTLKKPDETIEAEDVSAVSDYTVQFTDALGRTTLVLGGVERVTTATDTAPEFATIDTTGKPAAHPCQELESSDTTCS